MSSSYCDWCNNKLDEEKDDAENNECDGCGKVICLSCDQGETAYNDCEDSGKTLCADCYFPETHSGLDFKKIDL